MMAKGDIITAPGTGYVDCLTPDQKKTLKEVWSIILSTADSGEAIVPSKLMHEVEREAKSGDGSQSTTAQAAAEAEWLSGNKSIKAGDGVGMAKGLLADLGLSVDKLRPILWDNAMGDHPDALLLRFIRARKWNVVNTLNMLFKAFKWRIDEDIPAVKYSTDEHLSEQYPKFFEQLEMGKLCIHGTDVDNRIVVYLNVHLHHLNDQPPKTIEKLAIYVIECGRVLLEHPTETICLVFDLSNFGLSNMDFTVVAYLVTIFEAYYPESLGSVIIHGAPLIFWGIWKVIQPWLDPAVAAKVHFTRADKDLLEYIPAKHLPDHYKGGLDHYKYEYPHANPGENKCMEDTATKEKLVVEWKDTFWRFEALTREWIKADTPETEQEVEREREQCAKELRIAFFKMDPYIRARNMFHRTTPPIAQVDGSVKWVYNN